MTAYSTMRNRFPGDASSIPDPILMDFIMFYSLKISS